jgi:PII-like signaling protein
VTHKLLLIQVGENDMWGEQPLYEAITRKLMHLEAPGATVQAGIMGFGNHHHIHRKRLFGVPDDRPVSVSVVAEESFLRTKIIPAVKPMLSHGLMMLLDVEMVHPAEPQAPESRSEG